MLKNINNLNKIKIFKNQMAEMKMSFMMNFKKTPMKKDLRQAVILEEVKDNKLISSLIKMQKLMKKKEISKRKM
jgi:hypothetical protein